MIEGLGIDILMNERLETLENKTEFAANVFTPEELELTRLLPYRDRTYALYFSVKEAVLKALGCGLQFGSFWRDVEINNYPHVKTRGNVRDLAGKKSIRKIHTTSACTEKYALSVVLLESEN